MADTTRRKPKPRSKPVSPAQPLPVAAPGIDLGPLTERLGYVLRRAQLAVFQDFFASFAALDISPATYSALTVIEANPGLSQTRVADALGIQKSNFVAMIGGLETRGLVRREASPSDRRTYRLFLTDGGRHLVAQLHAMAEAHERRIAAIIGQEDYAALFKPLHALADGLKRPADS